MKKNLLVLILAALIFSCNQKKEGFSETDLIGKWTMYRGEVIINGETNENPATQGELIGFEFFENKTGLTTVVSEKFTWKIMEGNHLISIRDSIEWNYSIKRISKKEIEFIEEKSDRIFVWKLRKGWD